MVPGIVILLHQKEIENENNNLNCQLNLSHKCRQEGGYSENVNADKKEVIQKTSVNCVIDFTPTAYFHLYSIWL